MVMEVDMQTKQSFVCMYCTESPESPMGGNKLTARAGLKSTWATQKVEMERKLFCYQIRGEIALYSSLLHMVKNDKNKTIY